MRLNYLKEHKKAEYTIMLMENTLIEQPNITQSDIANKLKVSRQSIATNIKELKDNNVLERVGANKKGYWKILVDLQ